MSFKEIPQFRAVAKKVSHDKSIRVDRPFLLLKTFQALGGVNEDAINYVEFSTDFDQTVAANLFAANQMLSKFTLPNDVDMTALLLPPGKLFIQTLNIDPLAAYEQNQWTHDAELITFHNLTGLIPKAIVIRAGATDYNGYDKETSFQIPNGTTVSQLTDLLYAHLVAEYSDYALGGTFTRVDDENISYTSLPDSWVYLHDEIWDGRYDETIDYYALILEKI